MGHDKNKESVKKWQDQVNPFIHNASFTPLKTSENHKVF